ncbi:MAG: terminase TerL endonuclease subunit [Oscillospiraceae bacterium]
MATARQFLFTARIKASKDKQVFDTANRVEKIISEQGFEVRRMRKADIKRFLALYFEASMNGEQMSPPTKELMKLVLEQRIAHGGHPVLHWMMDNIFIRTDPAGNIKPDKEKSTEKIDGAVATIMALDRAIRCGNENVESVYDTRGLLFI